MIKQLVACIREYKKATIMTPILIMFECIMDIVLPLLMAALIDRGIDQGNMKNTILFGTLMFLASLVSMGIGILAGRTSAKASAGFAKNLRHDIYYKVQQYSFTNIDKFSTGSIVTRLTTDVTSIQQAFMMSIRMAIRAPAMIIFALIMVLRINARLSLIFLAIMPILVGGLALIAYNARPIFEKVFKIYDKLNTVVQENLRGIRVVKSFVREDHEREKFNTVSDRLYANFVKVEKILAWNNPLMGLCMNGCTLLVSWFGARIIISSHGTALTTGNLTSVISYSTQVLGSLMMLSMVFMTIIMSRASIQRVGELLNEKPDLTNPENAVTTMTDGSIRFDNVSFSYAGDMEKRCLFDVNLDIKSGEVIGILGSTGSAKSTLVQLIPRLYDVTGGSLTVGGVDVRDYDLETLRGGISMVLQKNELFSGTIRDNLRWGNEEATDEELEHVCRLAQADGFIREFPDGYDTYIEQGGTNVSGGQKQRLCIARALLKHPKVLILDDSTSAVDTQTDAMIRQAFREYIPETTKLIIAQRIASVEDADKIIIMENGRVTAFGTPAELLATNDVYQELYNSQLKGVRSDG